MQKNTILNKSLLINVSRLINQLHSVCNKVGEVQHKQVQVDTDKIQNFKNSKNFQKKKNYIVLISQKITAYVDVSMYGILRRCLLMNTH